MSERAPRYKAAFWDTDGTSADTLETALNLTRRFLKRFCKNPDLNFSSNDVDRWDYVRQIFIKNGFSVDEAADYEDRIWKSKYVLGSAKPVNGAPELVSFFYYKGMDNYSGTSRPAENGVKELTEEWIYKNLKYTADVFVNPGESNTKGPEFKADMIMSLARKYGSVLVLEDFPGHVTQMLEMFRKSGEDLDIHIILLPVGKIEAPKELYDDPMVTIVERDGAQGVSTVRSYLEQNNLV